MQERAIHSEIHYETYCTHVNCGKKHGVREYIRHRAGSDEALQQALSSGYIDSIRFTFQRTHYQDYEGNMAMTPLLCPAKPCNAEVNGMFVGKFIYIGGRVGAASEKFVIQLSCGDEPGVDVALRIGVAFGDKEIRRTSYKDGAFADIEKDGPQGYEKFPFETGAEFGFYITCRENGFEIKANGYHQYALYQHRMPFSLVTHVQVLEDCEVGLICGGIEGLEIPLYEVTRPPQFLDIPFHNIRERTVVLTGTPTSDGVFEINFTDQASDKIHIHMKAGVMTLQIVRNTFDYGWGTEEIYLPFPFPFLNGVPFQIKIKVEADKFVVDINGKRAFEYKTRLENLKDIRVLNFKQAVDIEKIAFY